MSNALIKLLSSYIGTNSGINIPIPANSTLLSGLATDCSGNIYIADTECHAIYRVGLGGTCQLLAGVERVKGYLNGSNLSSKFHSPRGLAVDSAGRLYVADTGNGKIRVVGIGTKTATIATGFKNITDISVALNGDIIAVDKAEHKVYRVEPSGRKYVLAGSSDGDVSGTVGVVKIKGSAAKFSSPEGVTIAGDGKIYVTDTGNRKIKVIETDGYVKTFSGTIEGDLDGSATTAQFTYPCDIAITPKGNKLFVLDKIPSGNKIKTIDSNGNVETITDVTTEEAIALTVDSYETIYCVTSDGTGLIDGEESSSTSSGIYIGSVKPRHL